MSVLVVDKPVGPSSLDVVKRVQRSLTALWGPKRVRATRFGHGGTLDPMASGVLPVCIGEGTKLAAFLLEAEKEYEATIAFGVETDTMDAAGAVTARTEVGVLTPETLEAALAPFRGPIQQVPPMYSALKRAGRPLYSYARAGEEVERAPRPVTIYQLELLAFQPPDVARVRVRCSKGTYIRVLAFDLGRALGTGAHLRALRRTASGPFGLSQAVTPEALESAVQARAPLPFVSLTDALAHLPTIEASEVTAQALTQGRRVAWETLGAERAVRARVLRPDGTLLAVAEPGEDGLVRTLRVFNREAAVQTCNLPLGG